MVVGLCRVGVSIIVFVSLLRAEVERVELENLLYVWVNMSVDKRLYIIS